MREQPPHPGNSLGRGAIGTRLAHNVPAQRPQTSRPLRPQSPVTRVLWPLWVPSGLLQDDEGDVIVFGGGFEVWADVVAGDCDRAAESLGGGECLGHGGRVTVVDLGDAVVLLPHGARQRLLDEALSSEDHLAFVNSLEDPDLATT